jgi:putative endonuclease
MIVNVLNKLMSRLKRLDPKDMDHLQFGRWSESMVLRFLKKNRMKILCRNYRVTGGELDIVAWDGEMIAFVEVKSIRSSDAEPELKVNHKKRKRLIIAAKNYIARYNLYDRSARFDVVTLSLDKNQNPVIRHEKDVFQYDG